MSRSWSVAAVVLLLLAGCSGTDDAADRVPTTAPVGPTTVPSGSVGTTATPTDGARTTPTTPASPGTAPPAEASGAAGAQAAFRDFWAAYDEAVTSGETAALERLSAPGCQYCATVVASVEQVAEQGQTLRGGTVSLTSATVTGGDATTEVLLSGSLDQAAGAVVDGTATLSSSPATSARSVDARLVSTEDGWRVVAVVLGPAG